MLNDDRGEVHSVVRSSDITITEMAERKVFWAVQNVQNLNNQEIEVEASSGHNPILQLQ